MSKRKLTNIVLLLLKIYDKIENFFFGWCAIIVVFVYFLRSGISYLVVGVVPNYFIYPVRISTEIALIVAIIISNSLFSKVNFLLQTLFVEKAIIPKKGTPSVLEKSFLTNLNTWLNHPLRILVGLVSALVVFVYYIVRYSEEGRPLFESNIIWAIINDILFLAPVLYAYFVGVVVWRIFIISSFVQRIPQKFDVCVRFGHPDTAGGLLPIGTLSLNMIYVTIIPTVLSTFFLLTPFLARLFPSSAFIARMIPQSTLYYKFVPVILGAGILGNILSLAPIFSFHKVMQKGQINSVKFLSKISSRIIELKMYIINKEQETNEIHPSLEIINKNISILEDFYTNHRNINTWPINRRIWTKILGTQFLILGQVLAVIEMLTKLF